MVNKTKIFRRSLYILMGILALFCILMITPRTIGAIFPEAKPIGYHFEILDYLAVAVGLESLINTTPEIPSEIEEIKNIEYKNIDGRSLQIDLYKPKNSVKDLPLLVFIHGGGWSGGQRSDYLVYLVAFAKKGYMTATVSYRLLKDGPYPACVEDIKDAFTWFYSNGQTYGYDPDRIAVIGGSAGGHLALLAAYGWEKPNMESDSLFETSTHRIKAVVDIYGPVDLTTEYARNHPLVKNFLAKSFDDHPEIYSEASPIQYADTNDPPTMILQGSSDNLVPASQPVRLKEKLDSLGIPSELYMLPLWPHTMDIVQRVNNFSQVKMTAFFEKYLK